MIRRSVLLALVCAAATLVPLCSAQTQNISIQSAIEVARAQMTTERTAIVGTTMNLNDKESAAFWPIYKKYESERSVVDDGRAAIIKEYAEKNATINDADAKLMTERMLDYDAQEAALKKKYFQEFSKTLPPTVVAKFFQLSHRIDLLLAMQIESSLPPIGGAEELPQLNSEQPSTSQLHILQDN